MKKTEDYENDRGEFSYKHQDPRCETHYYHEFRCFNCRYYFLQGYWIKKGIRKETVRASCSNCGCLFNGGLDGKD